MAKTKTKRWESVFYIGKVLRQLQFNTWQGKEGDWVESLTVINRATGEPVTTRFYSQEVDARRGAAQIFNHIDKQLLGSETNN